MELLVSSHGNQIGTHQTPSTTRYSTTKYRGIKASLHPLPCKRNQITYHTATKNCLLRLTSFHTVCQSSVPWMEDGHCRTTCRLDHKSILILVWQLMFTMPSPIVHPNTIALLPIEIHLFEGSPVIIGENVTIYMALSKPASKPVQFQLWNRNTRKFTNFPCESAMQTYMEH
jgi:hypothetical protein